ncbi:MAG: YggS family pyridoxal phosphate-dependent enzyme, partial [Candidatus Marinimicrobia bacterium]|nr:YggS family pyridoxal phosphate-dependent enzyme [Candidatus Neomarinimicrobiota bacterium]
MSITENYQKIRETIPEHVTIVVAAKQRNPNEIIEVIKAGATDIGENYVQEGESIYNTLVEEREKVRWHMIGHLQTNKIN